MSISRPVPPALRRALPWVAGWLGLQGALALAGWVAAHLHDEGDEHTAGIRRVRTLREIQLRPVNPELCRVRLDLGLAGGVLDLTALSPVPGGIDVTVHAVLGGLAVQVPRGWRVWWSSRGVGGIGADGPLLRTDDAGTADLRVYGQLVFGGIGIESVP
jgi:hypothetical protein